MELDDIIDEENKGEQELMETDQTKEHPQQPNEEQDS